MVRPEGAVAEPLRGEDGIAPARVGVDVVRDVIALVVDRPQHARAGRRCAPTPGRACAASARPRRATRRRADTPRACPPAAPAGAAGPRPGPRAGSRRGARRASPPFPSPPLVPPLATRGAPHATPRGMRRARAARGGAGVPAPPLPPPFPPRPRSRPHPASAPPSPRAPLPAPRARTCCATPLAGGLAATSWRAHRAAIRRPARSRRAGGLRGGTSAPRRGPKSARARARREDRSGSGSVRAARSAISQARCQSGLPAAAWVGWGPGRLGWLGPRTKLAPPKHPPHQPTNEWRATRPGPGGSQSTHGKVRASMGMRHARGARAPRGVGSAGPLGGPAARAGRTGLQRNPSRRHSAGAAGGRGRVRCGEWAPLRARRALPTPPHWTPRLSPDRAPAGGGGGRLATCLTPSRRRPRGGGRRDGRAEYGRCATARSTRDSSTQLDQPQVGVRRHRRAARQRGGRSCPRPSEMRVFEVPRKRRGGTGRSRR